MHAGKLQTEEREALQSIYLSLRVLIRLGRINRSDAQKSLECSVYGFDVKSTWRPTHITMGAARLAAATGKGKGIQRAHGVLPGRVDRHVRTLALLEGEEQPFEAWWEAFWKADATVLMTKSEHSSGVVLNEADLLPLPMDGDYFTTQGYGFKMRKKKEVHWLRAALGMKFEPMREP